MTWLAVAAGGAIGSVARHALNHAVHTQWLATRFPAATFAVNLAGCLLVGLLAGLLATNRIQLPFAWREFLVVGLLGGFTTFSTFGLETFVLGRTYSTWMAAWNVAAQVGGGLAAVWVGYSLATISRT